MTVRERLVDLLNDALGPDQPLRPDDLWTQRGDYRKARWDLARWGATIRKGRADRSVCSWSTMTQCVRHGFDITSGGINANADFEIVAKV